MPLSLGVRLRASRPDQHPSRPARAARRRLEPARERIRRAGRLALIAGSFWRDDREVDLHRLRSALVPAPREMRSDDVASRTPAAMTEAMPGLRRGDNRPPPASSSDRAARSAVQSTTAHASRAHRRWRETVRFSGVPEVAGCGGSTGTRMLPGISCARIIDCPIVQGVGPRCGGLWRTPRKRRQRPALHSSSGEIRHGHVRGRIDVRTRQARTASATRISMPLASARSCSSFSSVSSRAGGSAAMLAAASRRDRRRFRCAAGPRHGCAASRGPLMHRRGSMGSARG